MLYIQSGIIATAVMNFSPCAPEKKVNVVDFIPAMYLEAGEADGTDLTKMSAEDQAKYILKQFRKKIFSRR